MAVEVVQNVEVRKKLTPDDMLEMSNNGQLDGSRWELVDGELVELAGSNEKHDDAAGNVFGPLWNFAREAGGRAVSATLGLRVGATRSNVRVPDAGYISAEHAQPLSEHFHDGAPDLVVEVLSTGQYGEAYVKGKIREYFEAGAQLAWLLDSLRKEVRVYTPDSDTYTIMRAEAVLTLEPIIAGFSLKVADIFR